MRSDSICLAEIDFDAVPVAHEAAPVYLVSSLVLNAIFGFGIQLIAPAGGTHQLVEDEANFQSVDQTPQRLRSGTGHWNKLRQFHTHLDVRRRSTHLRNDARCIRFTSVDVEFERFEVVVAGLGLQGRVVQIERLGAVDQTSDRTLADAKNELDRVLGPEVVLYDCGTSAATACAAKDLGHASTGMLEGEAVALA